MDSLDRRVHQQDLRLDVSARLDILRSRLENQIDSGLRVARSMAVLLADEGEVSQERYSKFASEISADLTGIIDIAWAPDLVITHVYPIEGNEKIIGLDYRNLPEQIDDILRVRDTGTPAIVGPLTLLQGPEGFILRLPVFVPSATGASFRGILSLVFRLDVFLRESLKANPPLGLDIALFTDKAGALSNAESVLGNADVMADTPVSVSLGLPERTWTLYARPSVGWDHVPYHSAVIRLLMLGLVLLVLTVSLSALWMASSRRLTILKMAASDHLLEGVIRNAPGVFFTCHEGDSGKIEIDFISNACRDVWGQEPQDFYQNPGLIEKLMDPEQREIWKATIAQVRKDRSGWNLVWKATLASGQEKWLEGWGLPSTLENGNLRWDSFIVDITNIREKERLFERQTEIAHQAQKQQSIGQLTAGVAHDFNNLLAVIMGNLELLRDDITDAEQRNQIDTCLNAIRRGADLTSNMLAFARKARLVPSVIDLNKLASETRNWIGRTLPAHIDVETSLLAGLWAIEADPNSTESALLNLILNARDAMPEGGKLTIETANIRIDEAYLETRQEGLTPGRYVMLAVSDTGDGIAPENLTQIFEPFYSTKSPGAGSGLGLSPVD